MRTSRRPYSKVMERTTNSRLREIMTSLVRHLQAVAFRIGNRLSLMSPTLIIAALIAASPALATRVRANFIAFASMNA